MAEQGRPAIRASVDDFHNPRAFAMRAAGIRLTAITSIPMITICFGNYCSSPWVLAAPADTSRRSFDLDNDRPFDPLTQQAPPAAALIVDGIFLHRAELRSFWDLSVFLKVDFDVSVPRGAQRGPAAMTRRMPPRR